jgi:hypothetical protein
VVSECAPAGAAPVKSRPPQHARQVDLSFHPWIAGVEGMIVTQGGLEGGYGLYVRNQKPAFVYNFLSLERYTIAATTPLPKGKVQLKVDIAYSGKAGELGKAATVTITVNGSKVADGQLPKTIPIQISIGEGLDVGEDVGSAVDFTYKPPFPYGQKIETAAASLQRLSQKAGGKRIQASQLNAMQRPTPRGSA